MASNEVWSFGGIMTFNDHWTTFSNLWEKKMNRRRIGVWLIFNLTDSLEAYYDRHITPVGQSRKDGSISPKEMTFEENQVILLGYKQLFSIINLVNNNFFWLYLQKNLVSLSNQVMQWITWKFILKFSFIGTSSLSPEGLTIRE